MRVTIGLKIFAAAGAVILLMSGAAAWTTWKISQVTDNIDTLAFHFLPLNEKLANVQVKLLEQEVVLQRLINDFETEAPTTSIERHLSDFNELGAAADAKIEQAVASANAALATLPAAQAVEFGQLIASFQSMETQHQDIQDLVSRATRAHLDGNRQAEKALIDAFAQSQLQFDATIKLLVSKILMFSEEATLRADREEHIVLRFSIVVTMLAVTLGLIFASQVTRNLVRPLKTLRDRTHAVEVGDLSQDIPVTTSDEIADLTHAFNKMIEGLRDKERMKSVFGQYVDPRVVETMLAVDQDGEGVLSGERKTVTVFFSDIVGFTPIGERLSPVGLVRLMNEYLSLASQPIVENDGVIDKFIGDSIMAFWSPPFVEKDQQAVLACRAALAQFDQLKILQHRLQDITGLRRDLPTVNIRIGLASGDAVVGSIGSEHAKNFTVMGDTVNLGARLEGANKLYGTRVLVCETTRVTAGDAIEVREIDSIAVHGKNEPVHVFELLSLAGDISDEDIKARDAFEAGLAAYRRRDWHSAEEAFKNCMAIWPEDPPAKLFLSRVAQLREHPPDSTWDTVWYFTSK